MLYENNALRKTPSHKLDCIIIELCLSHTISNQIIYNFSERLNERLVFILYVMESM